MSKTQLENRYQVLAAGHERGTRNKKQFNCRGGEFRRVRAPSRRLCFPGIKVGEKSSRANLHPPSKTFVSILPSRYKGYPAKDIQIISDNLYEISQRFRGMGKRSGLYLVDRALIPRVSKYVKDYKQKSSDPSKVYIDIEAMIEVLRQRYPEYKRKTMASFRSQVQKAISHPTIKQLLSPPALPSPKKSLPPPLETPSIPAPPPSMEIERKGEGEGEDRSGEIWIDRVGRKLGGGGERELEGRGSKNLNNKRLREMYTTNASGSNASTGKVGGSKKRRRVRGGGEKGGGKGGGGRSGDKKARGQRGDRLGNRY
ncbi:hypothetical protein AAMO2058_001261800 [Amorphochlora amoebiformis]